MSITVRFLTALVLSAPIVTEAGSSQACHGMNYPRHFTRQAVRVHVATASVHRQLLVLDKRHPARRWATSLRADAKLFRDQVKCGFPTKTLRKRFRHVRLSQRRFLKHIARLTDPKPVGFAEAVARLTRTVDQMRRKLRLVREVVDPGWD